MELRRLLVILRRRLVLLVVLIAAGVVGAYLGSDRASSFQAQSTLYVGTLSSLSPTAEYGQAVLAATLTPIVSTPSVIGATIAQLHVARQIPAVVKATKATVTPGSNLIRISVEDRDPVVAQMLANGVANVFATQAKTLAPIIAAAGAGKGQAPVSVAQQAPVPASPQPTSLHRNMGLGALVGLLVGLALILVVDFIGLSARTPQQIETQISMPVIGIVPLQPQIERAPAPATGSRPETVPLLIGDDV